MADRSRRVRAFLDEQFLVLVIVLVSLAAVGGWLTYTTHVDPGTTTEERPGASWRTAAWFNHSATVTADNPVYPVGATLRERPVYFTEITPNLTGEYAFTYDASDSGELDGTVSLELVLRGVEDDRETTTVVWQTTRQLRRSSIGSLAPGDTVRVPFTVNVNRTSNRLGTISEQLGNPPGQPQMLVRSTVEFRGSVNGEEVASVQSHTLPISLQGGTYQPASPGRMADQTDSTRTVTVEQTYGPLRSVGAPVILVGALLSLAGLGVLERRDRLGLSPAERKRVAYEDDRADFDEWVSTIRLPNDAFELPRAEATSLSALVDFAIDTDNGVVKAPGEEAYYVVHGDYLYTYRPPAEEALGYSSREGGRRETPEGIDGPTGAVPVDGDPVTDGTGGGDVGGATDDE
ncbi:hypothetical protein DVK02_11355 [Halobellus sp. Atlit-31R]|nr:hypothetical protein DVK02_11355 [Halobellus sp. Atlit-31R]